MSRSIDQQIADKERELKELYAQREAAETPNYITYLIMQQTRPLRPMGGLPTLQKATMTQVTLDEFGLRELAKAYRTDNVGYEKMVKQQASCSAGPNGSCSKRSRNEEKTRFA